MSLPSSAGGVSARRLPRAGKPVAAQGEHVRIARALLGLTPAQLAAHIGLPARPDAADAARPAQTLQQLSAALQAIIGLFNETPAASERQGRREATPGRLDDLVDKYIVLRSSWEHRHAGELAARLTAQAGRQAAEPVRKLAILVDDASDVVVTVAAFLESFGYRVIRAADGDAAMMILATGVPVDLLISDYAMPGMTGRELVGQALQQRPELRALIITGYPEAAELASLPPNVMLLPKPFRRIELAERIQRLHDDAPGMNTGAATEAAGALTWLP